MYYRVLNVYEQCGDCGTRGGTAYNCKGLRGLPAFSYKNLTAYSVAELVLPAFFAKRNICLYDHIAVYYLSCVTLLV